MLKQFNHQISNNSSFRLGQIIAMKRVKNNKQQEVQFRNNDEMRINKENEENKFYHKNG